MMNETESELVWAENGPQVEELIKEFQRCTPMAHGWNRLRDNDAVRLNIWDNKHPDGKKHDDGVDAALPWDGASDCEVLLADQAINENVAGNVVAFWRAVARLRAMKPDQAGLAAAATQLLDWFVRNKQLVRLHKTVQLAAQYMDTYGWVVLHPTWQREIALKNFEVKLDIFVQLAAQLSGMQAGGQSSPYQRNGDGGHRPPLQGDPSNPMAQLPAMIMDPNMDEQTGTLMEQLYDKYIEQNLTDIVGLEEVPKLRPARARKIVRELRESGTATVPLPYVCRNEPEIRALRPYDEIWITPGASNLQESRNHVREYFTEERLRAKGKLENWDEEWIEEAVKQRGKFSGWTMVTGRNVTQDGSFEVLEQEESRLIEVMTAYTKRLDEDSVLGIYVTIYHPLVSKGLGGRELVAKHGLLDYEHGLMPFIEIRQETRAPEIANSRGLPEILKSTQRQIKVQEDSLVDRTSLTTLPPLLVPASGMEMQYRFGPMTQTTVMPGREPVPMKLPTMDALPVEIIARKEHQTNLMLGRMSADIAPARSATVGEFRVMNFLIGWTEAFQQQFQLIEQYLSDDEFTRITGLPPGLPHDPKAIAGEFDLVLTFNPKELDTDYTIAMLKAISEFVVPGDVTGVVDRAKLTQMQMLAINPAWARELVSDQAGASQKLFLSVRDEMAQMALGNEPQYVENDPTARPKLQFASQIFSANPEYQRLAQTNERFGQLLQKYAKNLSFSVTQQQNAQVGRIGVQPTEGAGPEGTGN